MSGNEGVSRAAPDESAQGLIEFYSSQATVMLAQYDNIVRLLGLTNDWTAPGTHCEVLLRNFLRSYLPAHFKADKGFIYGRRPNVEGTKHSPEIDILIHNEQRDRPLFRLDDFVIVRARASCGAIQVKRCMDSEQLENGINNVVEARDHFRQMATKDGHDSTFFFSAVLFFEEDKPRQDGKASKTYENCLRKVLRDPEKWPLAPDVIGSLKGHIFARDIHGGSRLGYAGYAAERDGQNIALQVLLWRLNRELPGTSLGSLTPQVLETPDGGRIDIPRAWSK